MSTTPSIGATLVSRPPESVRVAGGSLNTIAAPRVTPGIPSELLTQRPDIRRQESRLASATANVGSARAQFFPTISLTGSGGYQSSALVALFNPNAAFSSRLQREVLRASRRAFELSEQQLRAGTADIVVVLNTQLTLFQAEDTLSQAQLARLQAIVSLYQALGGGWEPKMERPLNAL